MALTICGAYALVCLLSSLIRISVHKDPLTILRHCNELITDKVFGHFPHELQTDSFDCGLACIRMILRYYGRFRFTERELAYLVLCHAMAFLCAISATRRPILALRLRAHACLSMHFKPISVSLVSCIGIKTTMWFAIRFVEGQGHRRFYIADPASRNLVYKEDEFLKCWGCDNDSVHMGVALFLIPTEKLDAFKGRKEKAGRVGS